MGEGYALIASRTPRARAGREETAVRVAIGARASYVRANSTGGGGGSSLSVHGNDGKTQMSQQRVGGISKSINIKKQTHQYKSSGAKQ